jgi:hypothetical protein
MLKHFNMFKILQLGYKVIMWYERASEDDKITKQEIKELMLTVLEPDMFDIDIKL